ncbi:MAG: A/G-specific adenine glycosylase [Balneolales bacterium]|nr:A/G-specific adenine glycosylase [Balneolales bacterium]
MQNSSSASGGDQIIQENFSKPLVNWYQENKRDLPWRRTSDPYLIWVSEIMLQQTRVDQAIPYYHRFTERFPDIDSLARAERQELLRVWEGLGYYSRARNLQDAAKTVVSKHEAKFPETYDEIIALKGIGPYTAAAISSIAFGLPHAVVDGNVIRVISRFFGIDKDVSQSAVKNEIQEIADELLLRESPSDFNQAMMELGATVCSPKNPKCGECPVQDGCLAFKTLQTDSIPYKAPKKKVPHHHIAVGVCENDKGEILIALRPEDKMLGGLWEFPGGKKETGETIEQTLVREFYEETGLKITPKQKITEIRHAYSHFKITLHAWICNVDEGILKPKASKEIRWIHPSELHTYPFPKANRKLTELLTEHYLNGNRRDASTE